jgi:hypothetical protein
VTQHQQLGHSADSPRTTRGNQPNTRTTLKYSNRTTMPPILPTTTKHQLTPCATNSGTVQGRPRENLCISSRAKNPVLSRPLAIAFGGGGAQITPRTRHRQARR